MQHQPRHRMHQNHFAEGRPAPRAPLEIDRRFHVHEGQRHEFGEAAGLDLQIADADQMPRPVLVALDVSEHDGRGRAKAEPMRGAHHVQPFVGADLVVAQRVAHLVVENFRRRARQGAEPGLLEPRQEFADRHAERLRALMDFERRERMHMHLRHRRLHRAADLQIFLAGVGRMDAALHADLGSSACPRLAHPPRDLVHGEIVGLAAQVLAHLAFREGAELALERTDVGVVDVAGDDIAHGVAVHLAAQIVRCAADRGEIVAARAEQLHDLAFAERDTALHFRQRRRDARGRHDLRRLVEQSGLTRRQSRHAARTPVVDARRAFAVDQIVHRLAQTLIDPAHGILRVGRIDRETFGQGLAGGAGRGVQHAQMRPRRFGIDVIGRHRRDAAPVVDAGGDQTAERAGAEIGRRLNVHRRFEDQPRDGDSPQMIVKVGRGGIRHPRAGLGPEVLHDHLLKVTVEIVEIAQRQQRVDALLARLADADQNAGGERHRIFAGKTNGLDPRRGLFVGRAVMRRALLHQALGHALQHDALRHRDPAQRGDILAAHQAGIDMRQQSGTPEHFARGFGEIGQRGGMAERLKLLARDAVAQFGLVAERKQRLLAAGRLARLGDRDHLVDRQERLLAGARRMGEGAVVADVAAKLRQRNEHLARIGDLIAMSEIAPRGGGLHQGREIGVDQRQRFVAGQTAVRREIRQHR